jgi:hypothetical protein
MQAAFSIFIAHEKRDVTLALLLKDFLEETFLDADVFVSSADLKGGKVWMEELRRILEISSIIMGIMTPYSRQSDWVLFECGAGFCGKKTIPIVADRMTYEGLPAPLKHLQARAFDADGVKQVIADIARLNHLRVPTKLEGLERLLEQASSFVEERRKTEDAAKPGKEELRGRDVAVDPNLDRKYRELNDRLLRLLTGAVSAARAAFEIGDERELLKMPLIDLLGVAKAVNVPYPAMAATDLHMWQRQKPLVGDPEWKKINARKTLDEIERALDRYEKSLE